MLAVLHALMGVLRLGNVGHLSFGLVFQQKDCRRNEDAQNHLTNINTIISTTARDTSRRHINTSRVKARSHLVPGVFTHVQSSHPHVRQQHLRAGVSHEGPEPRRHGQFQTGGVAPVLQLVRQEFHGHGLVLPERLFQQIHGQRPELTNREQTSVRNTPADFHMYSRLSRTHLEYSFSSSEVSSTTSLFLAS